MLTPLDKLFFQNGELPLIVFKSKKGKEKLRHILFRLYVKLIYIKQLGIGYHCIQTYRKTKRMLYLVLGLIVGAAAGPDPARLFAPEQTIARANMGRLAVILYSPFIFNKYCNYEY